MPQETSHHPHLFFTADKLPAIRAKTLHPRFRRDWEALHFQALRHLEEPLPAAQEGCTAQAALAGRAARLAFVSRVAEEPRFGRRALECFRVVLQGKAWAHHPQDCGFGLGSAALCHALALAYDLLAEELAAPEKQRFREACQRELVEVFLRECHSGENQHLYGQRTMNHVAVHASGAVCLLLALHGDGVDYSREIEIARAHLLRFVEWYDDAGAALEFGGYWIYGMGNALRGLAALRSNGWPKIFRQRSGKLLRTAYPLLCMSVGGKFVTNFSDGVYGVPVGSPFAQVAENHGRIYRVHAECDPRLVQHLARTPALILAAEFQDSRLQWYAGQATQGDELALICGDPDLPETPPDDLPTCVAYHGCGVGVLRSSMSAPGALVLGLKAGRARGHVYDDAHCQFDLNSVVLDGLGTTLLADPGYHHIFNSSMSVIDPQHISNSSPKHNTLLVDGEGQTHTDSPIAHLQDLSPGDEIDYVVSRMERGYGERVRRFDRHAYLVAKRVYLLLDDIELARPAVLGWNFHGAEQARLQPGATAVIECEGAVLRIIPFGGAPLSCRAASDHLLPRVQFETTAPVSGGRFGWLLLVDPAGAPPTAASAQLEGSGVTLRWNGRVWQLPVVVRRNRFVSDIMLPFRERPGKQRKLS